MPRGPVLSCSPPLARALRYAGGTHTVEDVEAGIAAGEFQKWEHDGAIVVTQVQQYPRSRELCYFLAAGTLDALRPMLAPLEEWGRQQGCTRAYLVGRAGWVRSFLAAEGYRPTAVVMAKDLRVGEPSPCGE